MSAIEHVIFDFDGTCTQIPAIHEAFAQEYRKNFSERLGGLGVTEKEWAEAQEVVRGHSPWEGWSVGGTPSAPVAADPYIVADEAAKLIARRRGVPVPSGSGVHSRAYYKCQAPWRPESKEVLCKLHCQGIGIYFVSNSSSDFVNGRLDELLGKDSTERKAVTVATGAAKFLIRELAWGGEDMLGEPWRNAFSALPAAESAEHVPFSRPIYLRRGSYLEAIAWTLKGDITALSRTLVCGDVWELDLAMPFHLGMRVHLIDRAAPFETYEYERARLAACGPLGGRSADLYGVLERVGARTRESETAL